MRPRRASSRGCSSGASLERSLVDRFALHTSGKSSPGVRVDTIRYESNMTVAHQDMDATGMPGTGGDGGCTRTAQWEGAWPIHPRTTRSVRWNDMVVPRITSCQEPHPRVSVMVISRVGCPLAAKAIAAELLEVVPGNIASPRVRFVPGAAYVRSKRPLRKSCGRRRSVHDVSNSLRFAEVLMCDASIVRRVHDLRRTGDPSHAPIAGAHRIVIHRPPTRTRVRGTKEEFDHEGTRGCIHRTGP